MKNKHGFFQIIALFLILILSLGIYEVYLKPDIDENVPLSRCLHRIMDEKCSFYGSVSNRPVNLRGNYDTNFVYFCGDWGVKTMFFKNGIEFNLTEQEIIKCSEAN